MFKSKEKTEVKTIKVKGSDDKLPPISLNEKTKKETKKKKNLPHPSSSLFDLSPEKEEFDVDHESSWLLNLDFDDDRKSKGLEHETKRDKRGKGHGHLSPELIQIARGNKKSFQAVFRYEDRLMDGDSHSRESAEELHPTENFDTFCSETCLEISKKIGNKYSKKEVLRLVEILFNALINIRYLKFRIDDLQEGNDCSKNDLMQFVFANTDIAIGMSILDIVDKDSARELRKNINELFNSKLIDNVGDLHELLCHKSFKTFWQKAKKQKDLIKWQGEDVAVLRTKNEFDGDAFDTEVFVVRDKKGFYKALRIPMMRVMDVNLTRARSLLSSIDNKSNKIVVMDDNCETYPVGGGYHALRVGNDINTKRDITKTLKQNLVYVKPKGQKQEWLAYRTMDTDKGLGYYHGTYISADARFPGGQYFFNQPCDRSQNAQMTSSRLDITPRNNHSLGAGGIIFYGSKVGKTTTVGDDSLHPSGLRCLSLAPHALIDNHTRRLTSKQLDAVESIGIELRKPQMANVQLWLHDLEKFSRYKRSAKATQRTKPLYIGGLDIENERVVSNSDDLTDCDVREITKFLWKYLSCIRSKNSYSRLYSNGEKIGDAAPLKECPEALINMMFEVFNNAEGEVMSEVQLNDLMMTQINECRQLIEDVNQYLKGHGHPDSKGEDLLIANRKADNIKLAQESFRDFRAVARYKTLHKSRLNDINHEIQTGALDLNDDAFSEFEDNKDAVVTDNIKKLKQDERLTYALEASYESFMAKCRDKQPSNSPSSAKTKEKGSAICCIVC